MAIYKANGISLKDDVMLRLETRPEELRQPGYEKQYDYTTLIYDCFMTNSGLVMVGPPLVNLEQEFFPGKIFKFTQQQQYQYFALDRCYSIHIDLEDDFYNERNPKLELDAAYLDKFREKHIEMSEENRIFDGKRVLYTLQKNNRIEWITAWIEFYVKVHKTNAVLIYDNASDIYSLEFLYEALKSIKGLDTLVLVDWPYPHGPGGGWAKDGKQISCWDSDFCQHGALESARKRFLANAKSVISVDIDELIVPTQTECNSIHELAENSDYECILVNGEFVSNATSPNLVREPKSFSHHDFKHTFLQPNRTSAKYCVVPTRSAIDSQWKVHAAGFNRGTQDSFVLRHFMAINNNWKNHRSNPCEVNLAEHVIDLHLDRVFQDNNLS